MSVGPLGGLPASAAGAPLAQSKGSDVDRTQQDSAAQQRRTQTDQKAESAAGIGETDGEDHATGERDADGRRLWEEMGGPGNGDGSGENGAEQHRSKDPSGQSGSLLDLSG
ncbi:MAG: hypothetical protein GXX96_02970 [Planctomycetaceae bacterium]|nr:hypothetical protein [Planctomycetaceae bacterium]